MKSTRLITGIVVSAVMLSVSPLQAQTEPELMRALLEEIRALRLTLQKSAALDLRAKVLIERARLQEQTVRELQREVDQRNMSRSIEIEDEPMETMVEQLNNRLRTETDAEQRRQIENELQMMQQRREMYTRHQERMRAYEQQMEARLGEEKNKLADIEREIMALEAEMSRM